jgi:UDP-glucose 4-epimerase
VSQGASELRPASVLVTGAAGYLGGVVVKWLAAHGTRRVVALDVRRVPEGERPPEVCFVEADVRSVDFVTLLQEHEVDTVVHLASIVERPVGMSAATAQDIDVGGTRRLLTACVEAGVEQFVVTSSGAAYGYHSDTPAWIEEDCPLRGDGPFEYALNKRLVEEELARWRRDQPQLKQLVFRPGTILGAGVRNQITNLFERPCVLGLRGTASPFVFVWDEDVARCIGLGVEGRREGIYNLAGDGVLTLRDIASKTGKPYLPLPTRALRLGLGVLRRLGLSRYGPEQVAFLEHRPVLGNERLKREFGYTPHLSSREVFELYWGGREAA